MSYSYSDSSSPAPIPQGQGKLFASSDVELMREQIQVEEFGGLMPDEDMSLPADVSPVGGSLDDLKSAQPKPSGMGPSQKTESPATYAIPEFDRGKAILSEDATAKKHSHVRGDDSHGTTATTIVHGRGHRSKASATSISSAMADDTYDERKSTEAQHSSGKSASGSSPAGKRRPHPWDDDSVSVGKGLGPVPPPPVYTGRSKAKDDSSAKMSTSSRARDTQQQLAARDRARRSRSKPKVVDRSGRPKRVRSRTPVGTKGKEKEGGWHEETVRTPGFEMSEPPSGTRFRRVSNSSTNSPRQLPADDRFESVTIETAAAGGRSKKYRRGDDERVRGRLRRDTTPVRHKSERISRSSGRKAVGAPKAKAKRAPHRSGRYEEERDAGIEMASFGRRGRVQSLYDAGDDYSTSDSSDEKGYGRSRYRMRGDGAHARSGSGPQLKSAQPLLATPLPPSETPVSVGDVIGVSQAYAIDREGHSRDRSNPMPISVQMAHDRQAQDRSRGAIQRSLTPVTIARRHRQARSEQSSRHSSRHSSRSGGHSAEYEAVSTGSPPGDRWMRGQRRGEHSAVTSQSSSPKNLTLPAASGSQLDDAIVVEVQKDSGMDVLSGEEKSAFEEAAFDSGMDTDTDEMEGVDEYGEVCKSLCCCGLDKCLSNNAVLRGIYEELYAPTRDQLFGLWTTRTLQVLYVIILGASFMMLIMVLLKERLNLNWLNGKRKDKSKDPHVADLNNWIFQVANVMLILSYATSNILALRVTLGAAGIFFVWWSATFDFGILLDTLTWNVIQVLINLRHAIAIFYSKRPIVFSGNAKESGIYEGIYEATFKGIMDRESFAMLLQPALIRRLHTGRFYAQRGDAVNNLSILARGRLKIEKQREDETVRHVGRLKRALSSVGADDGDALVLDASKSPVVRAIARTPADVSHVVNALQHIVYGEGATQTLTIETHSFMDSPEWIMRKKHWGKRYDVSFRALVPCVYVTWPRESLEKLLAEKPQLNTPLLGVLGIDVSQKLFATN